jgi:hypothetical protein
MHANKGKGFLMGPIFERRYQYITCVEDKGAGLRLQIEKELLGAQRNPRSHSLQAAPPNAIA